MPSYTDTNTDEGNVKRFIAPTMTRALELVRDEMGPEAVILSSTRVDGGVEIITSLEPDLPTRGINSRREFGHNFDADSDRAMNSDSAWRTHAGVGKAAESFGGRTEVNSDSPRSERTGKDLAREIELARERMLEAKRRAKEADRPFGEREREGSDKSVGNPTPYSTQRDDAHSYQGDGRRESSQFNGEHHQNNRFPENDENEKQLNDLKGELADMRMLLEQQLWKMSENNPAPVSLNAPLPNQVQLPAKYPMINDHLSRLGLSDEIVEDLVLTAGPHERISDSWRNCIAHLSKKIPVAKNDLVDSGGIFAFVGQTGVGKTTTIAKLAARYVLQHGPGKVAVVTTDTYRVGACDQLRSLGKILNVPVRAVDSEHSLLTVLASLRQFSLILVDTAGFRHGDPLLRDQLKILDTCSSMKRVLVMSCNSQWQTLKASTHAYASKTRDIDACVLTKLDETASLGEVLSVVMQKGIPVAYTTDGQEIPKDISCASGVSIVAKSVNLMKANTAETTNTAVF